MVKGLMRSYVMFVIENPHMIYCSSLAFSYFFRLENLLNRLQSVAKSVVKAEPKSSTLGPTDRPDSRQKRVKNESQPQSEDDQPLTPAAAVAAPDGRGESAADEERGVVMEEPEEGELVSQPAAAAGVLTLHAQEEGMCT